jgi:hypothetical protein
MSELLNSGQFGLTNLRTLAEQRQVIARNWEQSGLLEGLGKNQKSSIAQLLENQASYLLNEVTLDASAGRFDTVAFPMVRRIFSRLLANDIVSVQPLALPSGLLFYMDARVSTNKVSPYSIANGQPGSTYGTGSAYERFYDNNGYDASFGTGYTVTAAGVVGAGAPVGAGAGAVLGVTFSSGSTTNGLITTVVTAGTDFNISTAQSSASLTFTASTAIQYNGVQIFGVGQVIPFYSQMQTYGQDIFAGGVFNVVLDVRPAGIYGLDFDNSKLGPGVLSANASYNVYSTIEASPLMSELTIRFSSVTVVTETRKMRAHWTPELAQDLEAYHSIDAEAELTALLSEEVAAEIDREIIRDLIDGAMFRARWDYAGLSNNTSFFGTQKDWNQTLVTRINEVSAQIHKATLRGGATWVVCSAEAGAIFDDLEYFHVDGSAQPESEKYNLGIEKIGALSNRYTVYKDPYLPSNIVLLGHKGSTFLEAGFIYAPYIPLQLTATIYDPNDFTPRKGIMTRYGKKMVNNRFYGVIYLDNLNTYATVYTTPQN